MKHIFLTLTLLFNAAIMLNASESYQKNYSKSFDVRPDALLETKTSFGSLAIKEWDKNEIKVDITVTVDAKNEERAEEMFERIEVRLIGDQYRVLVENELKSKWNGGSNENLEIEIMIYAPQNAKLEVNHDFGSAEIGNFTNEADIKVSFGSVEIESLSHPQSQVKSEYGECTAKNVSGGELTVEFGSMEIMKLTGSAEIKSSYSSVEIHSVTQSAETLDIRNEFGSVEITLAYGASYRIEADSEFGDIELPNEAKIKRSEKEFTSYEVEATIGENPKGEIIVHSSFGEVTIDID